MTLTSLSLEIYGSQAVTAVGVSQWLQQLSTDTPLSFKIDGSKRVTAVGVAGVSQWLQQLSNGTYLTFLESL